MLLSDVDCEYRALLSLFLEHFGSSDVKIRRVGKGSP
jgi:hypothetical protein